MTTPKSLVIMRQRTPVINTKVISKQLKREHSSILKLFKTHRKDIISLENSGFEIHYFNDGKSQRIKEVLLTEMQATFLITLMSNTPEVIKFKSNLVRDFQKIKNSLLRLKKKQSDIEWRKLDFSAKLESKRLNKAIGEFIFYSKSQGSANADRYFSITHSMIHSALFKKNPEICQQDFRLYLSNLQRLLLETADTIAEDEIYSGIKQGKPYKEIYRHCRSKVQSFALSNGGKQNIATLQEVEEEEQGGFCDPQE